MRENVDTYFRYFWKGEGLTNDKNIWYGREVRFSIINSGIGNFLRVLLPRQHSAETLRSKIAIPSFFGKQF